MPEGAASLTTELLATTPALERLRPEWEELWAAAQATPFQSPHWLLPWWKHVGRGVLAGIALRCAGNGILVGLAPLYIHRAAADGRRHLFPLGIATTDYLDVLARPGWEAMVLRALEAHWCARSGDWDVLEAPQLAPGALLRELPFGAGWRRELAVAEPNPVLALDGSDDAIPAAVPRAMADNLRYCQRRAARSARVDYEQATAAQVPEFLAALEALHGQRWAERGQGGVLDAAVMASHRESTPALHAAGLLRLYGLRVDGALAAVLYCLVDAPEVAARRCYYYLGGFDPRLRALSPGTLLVAHAIAQAQAEGLAAFDFLRGAEAYKYRWGAVDQPMATLRAWRASDEPTR